MPWHHAHCRRFPDAGWGYYGTIWKDRSLQSWLMVIGQARLLPATVVDWLVDEVADDFLSGKVFVAPAEMIGIKPDDANPSLSAWAGISGGTAVAPDNFQTATELMALEIPFLDAMSPTEFRTFLRDYEGELTGFRQSFLKLVTTRDQANKNVQDIVKEIQFQIAELMRAEKFSKVRNSIATLGGTIATVSAAVAVAARPENPAWWAGIAGAGAAGVSLLNIWKQRVDTREQMAKNPYFILWKLGVTKPARVRKRLNTSVIKKRRMPLDKFIEVHGDKHWLCPPTTGFTFLVVEDKD
jgi:hypothetical protein